MKRFRLAILTMAFLGMTAASFAQSNNNQEGKQRPSQEEMIGRKADRMVAELGLNDKDAAKFRSIYIRHEKERMDAWKAAWKKDQKAKPGKKEMMSDSEVDAQMKARLEMQITKAKNDAKFYDELRTVLSARQAKKVLAFSNHVGKRGKMRGMHGKKNGQRAHFAKRQSMQPSLKGQKRG